MINKLYIKQCCLIVWSVEKLRKVKMTKRTKNGRIKLLSKCEVCDSTISKFIKEQEASGLLHSLGIKAPLKVH